MKHKSEDVGFINGIDGNQDVIFDSNYNFIIGHKYKFETSDEIKIKSNKCGNYNLYVKDIYDIEEDDEEIDLILEI